MKCTARIVIYLQDSPNEHDPNRIVASASAYIVDTMDHIPGNETAAIKRATEIVRALEAEFSDRILTDLRVDA